MRAVALIAAACFATLALAQLRTIPADAKRAKMSHVQERIVELDGKREIGINSPVRSEVARSPELGKARRRGSKERGRIGKLTNLFGSFPRKSLILLGSGSGGGT